jgi:integrase
MSIRKIRNNWWVDFRFDYVRYRKKSPSNSKEGAKGYEATLRSKLMRGEPIIEKKETILFKDFSIEWLEVYVKNNNKLSEYQHKESCLKLYLIPFFGKKPIDKITNFDIENFKAKMMKTTISKATINHYLSTISICLKTAEDWGLITGIPRIKRLKVEPNRFDFLTEKEAEKILAHSEGQIKEMIFFALKTGVRFGELIALDWNDINFQDKLITIRRSIVREVMGSTKSNRIRYIPLLPSVAEMLRKKNKKSGFVFTRKGEAFKQYYCCKKLYQACKKAGLRKIGWHKLRHTFASHLAQNGVAIQVIKELLGHSDITTTMRYAHLSPSTLKIAMDVLEPKKVSIENFGQRVGNDPNFHISLPAIPNIAKSTLSPSLQQKTELLGSAFRKNNVSG